MEHFKYSTSAFGPIDDFLGTFTADELRVLMLKDQYYRGTVSYEDERNYSDWIAEMEEEIRHKTLYIGTEEPHTIRFFYVPPHFGDGFEMFAISKISNNGECYMFGNSTRFLKLYGEIKEWNEAEV